MLLQGLGHLLKSYVVHVYCSSHDKDICKGTLNDDGRQCDGVQQFTMWS